MTTTTLTPMVSVPTANALTEVTASGKVKRTSLMSPDRLGFGLSVIGLVMAIMVSSIVFSFAALTYAASWTGNEQWTWPLAALTIDGAIIAYTATYAVFRWRGDTARRTLIFLASFTLVSVSMNFAHTASFWEWDFSSRESQFGVFMASIIPLAALASAEEVIRMAFARKTRDGQIVGVVAQVDLDAIAQQQADGSVVPLLMDRTPEPAPLAAAPVAEPTAPQALGHTGGVPVDYTAPATVTAEPEPTLRRRPDSPSLVLLSQDARDAAAQLGVAGE